ncbi:putative T7SS-secreted protein [Curtobacterium sp. NPDC098951]|uniref:putative T7SS-secreted protein n=1 Tax=Curtobacterium sp. NPDC098951 TaxID=3363974 RepID=UPI00382CAD56
MSPAQQIEGDPSAVRAMADHYRTIAADIRSASDTLSRMDTAGTSSDAIDAFVKKAGDLATKLRKAEGRYQDTGDALVDYAAALETAIDDAERAAASNAATADELESAERLDRHYSALAEQTTSPDDLQHFQDQATAQQERAASLRADAARATAALEDARRDRDRAADIAIARIDDATEDGLHDNAWNVFQHWMKENDAWLSKVSDYLGYIGAGLALVSLIFPPLAIVAAIAVGVMALGAAVDTARAAAGTGSWTNAVLSIAGCFTFGAGSAAAKAMSAEAKGVLSTRGFELAANSNRPRAMMAAVRRTFARSRPKLGDRSLIRAFGDPDIAQVMNYTARSVPGQVVGDAVRLNQLAGRARAWSAFNFTFGMTSTSAGALGLTDTLDWRWSPRLGTAW